MYQICYLTRENKIHFVGHISFLKENLAGILYLVSWFDPSQQLSTMQPLTPHAAQWDGEEDRRGKKKVKLVG